PALARRLFPVDLDGAVEVLALPEEARGEIEPGPLPALPAHVPLSDIARPVAGIPEQAGMGHVLDPARRGGVDGAVDVPVAARQEARPARGTQRIDHEGIAEAGALGGQAVQVRRPQPREAGLLALLLLDDAQGVPALVVGVEEDEVRARLGRSRPG